MLIGRWALTVLNPLEGQQARSTVVTYHADGSVTGALEIDGNGAVENQRFRMAGRWRIEGTHVAHSAVTLQSVGNSRIGAAMSAMFNRQATPGRADVHESAPTI